MNTITVAELIAKLQDQDPDAKVIFGADYGDRGRTEQALAIKGRIETVEIEESGYSVSGFAIKTEDDAVMDSDEYDTYLVIR